ncbi:MAG: alpha/beta fold hydrolase [candidate division Zixibacteria bacterium]|nr:alpha/beta fold hydrolase [candidate division Zixibacteria bacterium]
MNGPNHQRRWPKRLFGIFARIVVIYILLSLVLAVPFSNLLFHPPAKRRMIDSLTQPGAERIPPLWKEKYSVNVDVLSVTSTAGPKPIQLSAWWVYRDSSSAKPTVVFLAGNAGLNPAAFEDEIRLCCEMGFNCLLMDWRGYGASAGELLTYGWFDRGDFAAVVDTLAGQYGIDTMQIGIWGYSMGASNVVAIAALRPEIKAVLLYAPWSDPLPMAVHYVWRSYSVPKILLYFPVWTAIQIGTWRNEGDVLDPAEEAKKVGCPVLVVHGDIDDIVPPELTRRLFNALAGPKELVVIPGAQHNDLFEVIGQERYLGQMKNFFLPLLADKNRLH